jgi:hypothetical protein
MMALRHNILCYCDSSVEWNRIEQNMKLLSEYCFDDR